MKILDYVQPKELGEALSFLGKSPETTKMLAGGTDLINQMRTREVLPEYILDLNGLKELQEIRLDDGNLIVGSMTTFDEIEHNPLVLQYIPALAEAAGTVGSPQIRHRGTIGGNVANAAVAADSVPVLLSLDAQVKLVSAKKERVVDLQSILVWLNETSIEKDEILTEIIIPLPKEGTIGVFEKLGRRRAMAIARLNLGLHVNFDADKKITEAKLALGSVGTTAYRVKEVEDLLVGKALTDELIQTASEVAAKVVADTLGTRPTATYKKTITGASMRKALNRLKVQCEGGLSR